jgi:uncharacterized protein YjbI with pentapeptide repeats
MLRMLRTRTAALACLVDLACSKQTTVAQMAASLLMQIVQPLQVVWVQFLQVQISTVQLLQVQFMQVQISTVQMSKVSMSKAHVQRTISWTVPKIWSSCKTRFPLRQVEPTRWTTLTTTRFLSTRTVARPVCLREASLREASLREARWREASLRKAISSTTGIWAANCCHS